MKKVLIALAVLTCTFSYSAAKSNSKNTTTTTNTNTKNNSKNFKGTEKEFFEVFNPNFDTFTKKDGSVFSGKLEVLRNTDNSPWFTMNVSNGKKNGETIFYFPNGKVKSKSLYNSGKIYGDYVFYNPNGEVLYKTTFVNGTGITKDYTDDGKLFSTVEFVNGLKEGAATTYNSDGAIVEEIYYIDGRVDEISFYSIGNALKNKTSKNVFKKYY